MTVVGPLLMAAVVIFPAMLAKFESSEVRIIAVIDSTHVLSSVLKETKYIKFETQASTSLEKLKKEFSESKYYAVLYVPGNVVNAPKGCQLFSNKQPNLGVKIYIENAIEKELEKQKLLARNIDENILESVKTDVEVQFTKWTDKGEEKQRFTELKMALGFIGGILIYFFIFMYGAQVMRGVIEEKTSRIVEIIISSVKPFQLMMGKIVGVAMVGLTQFVLWVVLTLLVVTVAKTALFPGNDSLVQQQEQAANLFSSSSGSVQQLQPESDKAENIQNVFQYLGEINYGVMLFCFLFYFIGGYLLYASLFAAIGGAVDSDADTQQFMLPITMPLIIAFLVAQSIIQNPEGAIAFWFSIIPLTSPVVMMVRIPFGVPAWEIILSMILLVLGFIGTTWMAGKIYRTGILMYGKKVNYRELWKWLRYKS